MNTTMQAAVGVGVPIGAQEEAPSFFKSLAFQMELNNDCLQGAIARLNNFLTNAEVQTPPENLVSVESPEENTSDITHPRARLQQVLEAQTKKAEMLRDLALRLSDIA